MLRKNSNTPKNSLFLKRWNPLVVKLMWLILILKHKNIFLWIVLERALLVAEVSAMTKWHSMHEKKISHLDLHNRWQIHTESQSSLRMSIDICNLLKHLISKLRAGSVRQQIYENSDELSSVIDDTIQYLRITMVQILIMRPVDGEVVYEYSSLYYF